MRIAGSHPFLFVSSRHLEAPRPEGQCQSAATLGGQRPNRDSAATHRRSFMVILMVIEWDDLRNIIGFNRDINRDINGDLIGILIGFTKNIPGDLIGILMVI